MDKVIMRILAIFSVFSIRIQYLGIVFFGYFSRHWRWEKRDSIWSSLLLKSQKYFIYIVTFVWICSPFSGEIFAQSITRIAVVDYQEIIDSFPNPTPEWDQIHELRTEAKRELRETQEHLALLVKELRAAELASQPYDIQQLKEEIVQKKEYGKTFIKNINSQIKTLQEQIDLEAPYEELHKILPEVMAQVARERGFSLLFNKDSPSLFWHDTSIDITVLVSERIRKKLDVQKKDASLLSKEKSVLSPGSVAKKEDS